jgi:hypothetical protein
LIFDGRIINTNIASITETNGMYNSSLGTGSHMWQINCSDSAGNLNNSVSRSLTITSSACTNCGGGGGGGGGGSSFSTYSISSEQAETGYTQNLKKDDIIKFSAVGENHTLKVKSLSQNSAEILIESNPVSATLSAGEEKKINLDNDEYFDLYLKLNSISSDKANITIKSIREKEKTFTIQENKTEENTSLENYTTPPSTPEKNRKSYVYIIIIVIIIGVFIIFILKHGKKTKAKPQRK